MLWELIHQKHLRILANGVFKSLTDINTDFTKSYFTIKEIPTAYDMDFLSNFSSVSV